MRHIERYGKMVWENEKFEDQRRGNCLCHQCGHMKPGQPDHCQIAAKFYDICKAHGCAFILTRCEAWIAPAPAVFAAYDSVVTVAVTSDGVVSDAGPVCDHNEMVAHDEPGFAWRCAKCGYVYGKPKQEVEE